jgi:hypothetical protein
MAVQLILSMAALAVASAARPQEPAVDMPGLLARVAERVEQYFARAQNIICTETVRIQRLGADLLGDGSMARQIVSELRTSWEVSSNGDQRAEPTVLRVVRTVNGRPPRAKDDLACMDPRPISPEPLALLLPDGQRDYSFRWAGLGSVGGRRAAMIDYRSLETGPPVVSRHDDCVSYELPGRIRGRVWIDQETGDILRLDQGLTGMVDIPVPPDPHRRKWNSDPRSLTIQRLDTSIRYKRVTFQDPEETLVLPATIDSLSVVLNSGSPRVRTSYAFSDYHRFVTEGRIVR